MARGVRDPLSLHFNHVFLNFKGTFYDPSYGIILENGTKEVYKNNNLQTRGGVIYKATFNSTGLEKFYYWIGK